MGKIKIEDLPKDMEITREEMKKITGSGFVVKYPNIFYKIRFMEPVDVQSAEPLEYS